MSLLVLQSFWWGRESWLLCLVCLPGVSWLLCDSSSRCHGVVCSLWLWYFLIILTYHFIFSTFLQNFISIFIIKKSEQSLSCLLREIVYWNLVEQFHIHIPEFQNNPSCGYWELTRTKFWTERRWEEKEEEIKKLSKNNDLISNKPLWCENVNILSNIRDAVMSDIS